MCVPTYTEIIMIFFGIGLMSTYGLLEHFQDTEDVKKLKDYDIHPDTYINREIFKDKKLNKLWTKAEMAGFSSTCFVHFIFKYFI